MKNILKKHWIFRLPKATHYSKGKVKK
jgi:hypothetical protein